MTDEEFLERVKFYGIPYETVINIAYAEKIYRDKFWV